MATQIMQAMGPTTANHNKSMRSLPSVPSPTLTNPDMVLPNEPNHIPSLPSPPQTAWRYRPPSPSYLKDKRDEGSRPGTASSGGGTAMSAKKEKRGLMSRKMMLLRSRTASSGAVQLIGDSQPIPRSTPSDLEADDYDSAYASSPTLMDVGNLAPEQPEVLQQYEDKRMSTGRYSTISEDMSGLPQFLAKYENRDETGTDDESDADSPTAPKYGYSVSIEGGMEAQRKQQEEDEHNSAILSKRAEQILANAKKRLNVRYALFNFRGTFTDQPASSWKATYEVHEIL